MKVIRKLQNSVSKRLNAKKPKYYGLNELDRKLEPYVNFDGGFYVELGANDGITQSNTYHLERYRGWNGVLVEPAPHNYLKCLARRGANNSVFCNACVDFSYSERFVEILYSNLMSIALGVESTVEDPRDYIERSKAHLPDTEANFSFGAVARTLSNILSEADAPARIDLLSLDVEGAELAVLKGIDHQKFRFRYMLVEHWNFEELSEYLSQHGYAFETKLSEHDYLFKDASQHGSG